MTTSPLLRALQEPKLARAVIAVLEHPGVPYSVDSLASLAGMSRTSFAVRFVEVFGQGPMDFVQKVRLRIAARLLTATDLPVKVIASSVGYASRTRVQSGVRDHLRPAPVRLPQFRRRRRGRTGTRGEPRTGISGAYP